MAVILLTSHNIPCFTVRQFTPTFVGEGLDWAAPAKPTGLTATATHDRVVLTWNDPGDDSITGYVIPGARVNDTGGPA